MWAQVTKDFAHLRVVSGSRAIPHETHIEKLGQYFNI